MDRAFQTTPGAVVNLPDQHMRRRESSDGVNEDDERTKRP